MTQMTASEKDMFLQTLDRECQTTLKLLHAYPAEKSDLAAREVEERTRAGVDVRARAGAGRHGAQGPVRAAAAARAPELSPTSPRRSRAPRARDPG